MVVLEARDLRKAMEMAKKLNLSFNYKSFTYEDELCYEIFSSSKVMLALLLKEFVDKSEITRTFEKL